MTILLIFASILAIVSLTIFFKKLDEFMSLIESIEESINKICEKENTK